MAMIVSIIMNTRDIVIDADHILYLVAFSKDYNDGFDEVDSDSEADFVGFGEETVEIDLTPYKKHFKAIIEDYITTAEVESIAYNWTIGKIRVILSDHKNFRYDIYPEYKAKRETKNPLLSSLKKWAMKKYHFEKNTEADEVVSYYVKKGGLGFTTDKDLFKGVAGRWFNSHYKHRYWVKTSKEDAHKFMLMQVLAGDPVDEIPALPRVGLLTAKKLLDKFGWDWKGVVKAYESKGFDEDYAILTRNLVDMNIWHPKKGITLWKK